LGAAGLAIGSEMSGGVSNVTFSDCRIYESMNGIRVKSARGRGSVVENVLSSNIQMQNLTRHAVELTMFGGNRPSEPKGYRLSDIPVFRNLVFENFVMDSDSARSGINIEGESQILRLIKLGSFPYIYNVSFNDIGRSDVQVLCSNAKDIRIDNKKVSCKVNLFPSATIGLE
jgi:polygalacturonase